MTLNRDSEVIIVGAGVVGVSTAFALARAGLKVTVIDRASGPATETSFANGAQLSYSYSDSIAAPHNIAQLMKWIAQPRSPVVLDRTPKTAEFAEWMLRYLWASRPKAARAHGENMLRINLLSRRVQSEWQAELGTQAIAPKAGILYTYTNPLEYQRAAEKIPFLAAHGVAKKTLTREETLTLEPALASGIERLAGAIHSPDDDIGDPYRYTHELVDHCTQRGVRFVWGASVRSMQSGKRPQVLTEMGDYEADAVIIAAASYTPALLRSIGLRLPMQPMKGYSLTFSSPTFGPRASISDVARRLVHTRIGTEIRIAGFAEFAGHDTSLRPELIDRLRADALDLIPGYDIADERAWACLRATPPDGLPVIGPTRATGIWLNTGHCMLGWTQAAGSAELLAAQMLGHTTPIDDRAFLHARF